MLGKNASTAADLSADYKEESVKVPSAITLLLLILIVLPLGTWIYRINIAGKDSSNVSKYEKLVADVDENVQVVQAILTSDAEEMEAIHSANRAGTVRLIVPEVVIVEKREPQEEELSALDIELDGIYWRADNPLVTIDGETYRIGETIHGYTIVEIGKHSVILKAKDGTLVEKDMYENLLQKK